MSAPSLDVPPPSTSFPDAWRRVMTDPRGFFAEMPVSGGLAEPLIFLLICVVIDAAGLLVLHWSIGGSLWSIVALAFAAFVVATVLTLVTQQLFDGKAGFEPTFRVVAYASAPAVFFWIPRVAVIAWLWSVYLQVRGIEVVHDVDTTRAVMAIVVTTAVIWILALGLGGTLV